MHEHLHVLILAQVEGGVAIDGLRLAGRQVLHHHVHGLLVGLGQLRLRGVGDAGDARRQHIVDGALVVVLLDVDGADLQRAAVRARGKWLVVGAPLATHQVEAGKAQHDGLLELGEEHTHEANAGEVGDVALAAGVLVQGYAELIPLHDVVGAVAQHHAGLADIGDEVLALHHVLRTDAHLVFEIALILVQRVVLVDVLHVGVGLVAGVIALGLLVAVGRVALRHVDALVSLQDVGVALVEVAAAEVVVVVVGGVEVEHHAHAVVHRHLVEEGGVGRFRAFFLVGQSVQSHVLLGAGSGGGGKGVGLRSLDGNLTPCRIGKRAGAIDGDSALIEFLAVAQDVLAHLAEVDVEVAAIVGGIALLVGIVEGVHEPELDILHVGSLEVVGVELAHHAAPPLQGIAQCSVEVDVGGQVVGTALRGVVGQVEHGQRVGGSAVG